MKIYFACSVRGGGDTSSYIEILHTIKAAGAEVISEVFTHDAIHLGGSPLPSKQIYDRDITMIQECDAVIAEVTNPSLGVGYELAYAEKINKPIMCLFNTDSDRELSAMIDGNSYFNIAPYTSNRMIRDAVRSFIN